MTDQNLDRRVRRTYTLLSTALIDLTLNEGYDNITIRDITDKADVAYATFFRHFEDKDDLLHHTLQTLIEAIEGLSYDPPEMYDEGLQIFLHVQQHSDLYRVLLSSRGAHHIIEKLKYSIAGNMLDSCVPHFKPDMHHVPPELVTYQFASSIISMVQWWLDDGMTIPPETMASHYFSAVVTSYFIIDTQPDVPA